MTDGKRVLIIPKQQTGKTLQHLWLPHPRTNELCNYYADTEHEVLLEPVQIDMAGKRSWMGNEWVSSNGSATMLTPIDPLFICLALITNMSMQGGEGRFVNLDDLRMESNERTDGKSIGILLNMKGIKPQALSILCETRDITDDMQVVRIDGAKTMEWLKSKCKADRLPEKLGKGIEYTISGVPDTERGALVFQAKEREMALLVSEYLSEQWTARLFKEFGDFAQITEYEKQMAKQNAKAVVYDDPESYAKVPGGVKKSVKEEVRHKQNALHVYVCVRVLKKWFSYICRNQCQPSRNNWKRLPKIPNPLPASSRKKLKNE